MIILGKSIYTGHSCTSFSMLIGTFTWKEEALGNGPNKYLTGDNTDKQ